jgi:hypothetical protein
VCEWFGYIGWHFSLIILVHFVANQNFQRFLIRVLLNLPSVENQFIFKWIWIKII